MNDLTYYKLAGKITDFYDRVCRANIENKDREWWSERDRKDYYELRKRITMFNGIDSHAVALLMNRMVWAERVGKIGVEFGFVPDFAEYV